MRSLSVFSPLPLRFVGARLISIGLVGSVCIPALSGSLAAWAAPLSAQQPAAARSGSRSEPVRGPGARAGWYSLIGAAAGGVMAMGFYAISDNGSRASGCKPLSCALPFLSVSGAVSGLFIARELDAGRRAHAPRTRARLNFGFSEASLLSAPTHIDGRDSLIAVVSDSGTQLVSASAAPKALRRRASGLTGLRQVVIVPLTGSLVIGSGTALWETSLASGPAARIGDGPVDALAASGDAVLSAVGRRLRLRRGMGATQRTDTLLLSGSVSALVYDETAHLWWAALDSTLVQIVADSTGLRTGMALDAPTGARAITTSAGWIAAALGDAGIIAWRRESLAGGVQRPVRVSQEPRFAYDLAFVGDALYVAGGVDGLYQLSLSPVPRVLGSSRQFPFATSVRAQGGVVWVGDRTRQSILRVTP